MEFRIMLNDFRDIIEKGSNVDFNLGMLIKKANSGSLNYRQIDAIIGRCEGYLRGVRYFFIENNSMKSFCINDSK